MQLITAKRHSVQMSKPNINGCKNGKQTNLLAQGTRGAAVQKSQVTVPVTVDTRLKRKNQAII